LNSVKYEFYTPFFPNSDYLLIDHFRKLLIVLSWKYKKLLKNLLIDHFLVLSSLGRYPFTFWVWAPRRVPTCIY